MTTQSSPGRIGFLNDEGASGVGGDGGVGGGAGGDDGGGTNSNFRNQKPICGLSYNY